MKIRIYDDSVRLRLDRAEVERIGRLESIECATRFPSGDAFRYRLRCCDADAVGATFAAGCIEIALPAARARHWAETESEVAIAADAPLDRGRLSLLIEKDFECLEPRAGEDQSNRFRNPKASA